MSRLVYLLIGAPGSGKSTFARELIKNEPNRYVRVNKDDLRNMAHDGVFSYENEEYIRKAEESLIKTALRDGYDMVWDNTHCNSSTRKKAHNLLEGIGDIKVVEKVFATSLDECLRRNALREGRANVPVEIVKKMFNAAKGLVDREVVYPPHNQQFVKYVGNPELPKAIICDLDGSLATIGDRSPYDASECDVKDTLNEHVAECVRLFYASGHKIVYCSGRMNKDRTPTIRFIEHHLPGVEFELFMRDDNDTRKDDIIKGELFEKHIRPRFNVRSVFDDRLQVCRLWHLLGLPLFRIGDPDANF